jgi:hypothetical protein
MIDESDLHWTMDIIERHITEIEALRYSEQAKPLYDILGDMILWDDEMPEGPFELVNGIRVVLHLRTRRAVYDRNMGLAFCEWFMARVPSWPGFRTERCDAARLRTLYEELKVPVGLPPQ